MKRIVERMPGGWLKIHTPAYNDRARAVNHPGLTDAELVQVVIDRHQMTDYFIIEDSAPGTDAFLRDRDFRDAWEAPTGELAVNMAKARSIVMAQIRRVRNLELAALDVPFVQALESGDTEAQIAIGAKKQALRDIPQTFHLTARTPSQLKNLWPDELPRE